MFDHWYTDYIDDENKPVREAAKAAWDFQQYKLEELSKQRDELMEACKAFLRYDEGDQEDGVQLMIDYADALALCKYAVAIAEK